MLSSIAEIQSLLPLVRRSPSQNDILRNPGFALAGVSRGWTPRAAAVRRGRELVGLIVAKEKLLPGPRLGVAYADLTFGSTLLGDPTEQRDAFLVALETLLESPGMRGLRLRLRPHSPELEAVRELLASKCLDVHFSRVKDHASLSLPGTYEQLLLSFGNTTRHNFRYYRPAFRGCGSCLFGQSFPG